METFTKAMFKAIFLSLLSLSAVALTPPAFASSKTVRIEVNGMVCAFCSAAIEKKLKAMPDTQAVYVNLDKKIVALELKDGKSANLEAVKAQVIDAGYDVRAIAETNQSIAQIKAGLK
jgi:copper chaperone CopZ